MSGKQYIFILIVLLKFTCSYCRIFEEIESEPGIKFKLRNKRSTHRNREDDGVNSLSDDEISSALSGLSIGDLNALNNLMAAGRGEEESAFARESQSKELMSHQREIRDTAYNKAKVMSKVRRNRSPEEKIHEELQSIRQSIENKFKANIVRKKRESSGKHLAMDDWKDESDYLPNDEYIKMLENSFPNSEITQPDNKGHIRVKRNLGLP